MPPVAGSDAASSLAGLIDNPDDAMNTSEQQLMSYRRSRGSLFTRLRSYFFFVPVVYLYTGVMGTLSLIASLFDGTGRVQHWFARTWSRMILATIRVRVQVEGREHIDPSRAAIY